MCIVYYMFILYTYTDYTYNRYLLYTLIDVTVFIRDGLAFRKPFRSQLRRFTRLSLCFLLIYTYTHTRAHTAIIKIYYIYAYII